MIRPRPRLLQVIALALLLPVVGCTAFILTFEVPAEVLPGQVFEVVVTGQTGAGNSQGPARVGCVMQMPANVRVVRWTVTGGQFSQLRRNEPALRSLYKAETGQSLEAFSGTGPKSTTLRPVLRVLLRAPSQAGPFKLKVAAAAQDGAQFKWILQHPNSTGDFSKISGAPFEQTITVTDNPKRPMLALEVDGALPYPNNGFWSSVAFGDVDQDGRADLAAASAGTGPFLYGAGRGTLGRTSPVVWRTLAQNLQLTAAGFSGVAFGDFNGDRNKDVACANGQILFGDGKGSFKAFPLPRNNNQPLSGQAIAAGDINNDGFDDVVVNPVGRNQLRAFLSNGKGGWTESSKGLPNQGIGVGPRLLLEDLDGDGNRDILWTRDASRGGTTIWQGDGRGGWKQLAITFDALSYHGAITADLDGDGSRELVFGIWGGGAGLRIWKRSGGRWAKIANTNVDRIVARTTGVAAADFDGDGDMDLVFGAEHIFTGVFMLQLWLNDGQARFTNSPTNGGLPRNHLGKVEDVQVGDLDGDGWPDLAVAVQGMGILAWRNSNTGFHRFGSACRGNKTQAPRLVSTGDLKLGAQNFTLGIDRAPANRPAILALGISRTRFGPTQLPLDLGFAGSPGCSLYTSQELLIFLNLDQSGSARIASTIPNTAALFRQLLYSQAAVHAPAANPSGLLFTSGGGLRVGK